jgi:hypothetical protein
MDRPHDRVARAGRKQAEGGGPRALPGEGSGRGEPRPRRFHPYLGDLEALRDRLVTEAVTHVATEETGVFWKQEWFVLKDAGFETPLVNSSNMRMVPGHNTTCA